MAADTTLSGGQRIAEQAAHALYERDRASQALGMRLTAVGPGTARVVMTVRGDMLNGHRTCHGGLLFALADSAFAFACNSYNDSTVAAAAAIDFLSGAREGDELTAEARELWRSARNGIYEITVSNQRGERVALFRGRSYRIEGQVTTLEE
ncbi:MAG TPA: hydroxyphenylacetyl-CoA thioesterase PaaI [Steroidobacteraceae bacterium]|jgi:acyl-CoA thioesterase|nr:hydroxyphenylacetyl-CoA thioesterase PaaI [Steroidobacteraceae bacterium]